MSDYATDMGLTEAEQERLRKAQALLDRSADPQRVLISIPASWVAERPKVKA